MKVKSPESSKPDVTRKVSPRNRIKYTAQQLHRLEKTFLSSQYPDSSILEDLSNTLNIDTERLSTWFQNRRSKFKRQAKGSHVNWMRQQLYQAGAAHPVVRDQSEKETSHVLSPPVVTVGKEAKAEKPKSNLQYLPSEHGYQAPNYDVTYNQMTSSTYPSLPDMYRALSDTLAVTDSLKTYGWNETSYLQPPSWFPQDSFCNTLSPMTASYYQNSAPSYNFPSAQINFQQI